MDENNESRELQAALSPEASSVNGIASKLTKIGLTALGCALVVVFFWPRWEIVVRFVVLAAMGGGCAAALCGLTYWRKARIRIGRLGLRYKSVRWVAAMVAVAGL